MEKLFSVASVMVVDDEAFSRGLVARLLKDIGIGEIVEAENGARALELLKERKASLDLVVCDVNMPEMDGYEFIRRVRYGEAPKFKEVPVVVLTGEDGEKSVRHARILKIDGFVVKPPDKDVFERQIRRIVSASMRQTLGVEDEK